MLSFIIGLFNLYNVRCE